MNKYLKKAVQIAQKNVRSGKGGPFGCVILKGDKVIATGQNQVTRKNDPTLHAEVVAIRKACRKLKSYQLSGCTIISSCEPCPMCLGAIYWARPKHLVFASSAEDAARVGFDDAFIYQELDKKIAKRKLKTTQIKIDGHLNPFDEWKKSAKKIRY